MNFVTVLFFLGLLLTIVASVGLLRLTGKKAPQEQRLWPLAQKPAADEMVKSVSLLNRKIFLFGRKYD